MLIVAYSALGSTLSTLLSSHVGARLILCTWPLATSVLSAARYSVTANPLVLFMLSFFESSRCFVAEFKPSVTWVFVSLTCESVITNSTSLASMERLWPALRWQEREGSDMLGIFIANKRDRRSLFLPSLLGLAPLRRATPTCGFFEVSSSPILGLSVRRLGSS